MTRVRPDTLEIFYGNWHACRFPRGVPVKVIASGIEPEDLFFVRPEEVERRPSVRSNAGAIQEIRIRIRSGEVCFAPFRRGRVINAAAGKRFLFWRGATSGIDREFKMRNTI